MSQDRMIWLDCLRLLAGVSMVVLHTTADPNGQPWTSYNVDERVGPIALRTVAYMARTELFLLIASFLLIMSLNKRPRSYGATIVEQSRRLLIPFVFWTVFYAFYSLIKASHFGYFDKAVTDLISAEAWLGYLLLGDVKYHMHFLPTLFGLLLFYPLFRKAYDTPLLGLAVFPLLLIKWELDRQIWSTFWDSDVLSFVVRSAKILTYIGFGMAAASLVSVFQNTTATMRRSWLPHLGFLAVFLVSFKAVSSYKALTDGQWQYSYFPGYLADFMMPLILFFFCMALSDHRWPKAFAKMGAYSFGLYLCHPIFVDLTEIGLQSTTLSPSMQVGLKLGVALSLTPALVFALSKFRATAWTIGLGSIPNPSDLYRQLFQRSDINAVDR